MNVNNEAGLGLAIYWVQRALILAYEDNSFLRAVKTGRKFLTWTVELESLRRGVRCSAVNADQIRIRMVKISIGRISGIIGRGYGKPLKIHGETS
jgi:hypothetical protein